jgi:hypothetical protein
MTVKTDTASGAALARARSPFAQALAGDKGWLVGLLVLLGVYYLVCYALSGQRPAGAFLGWAGWVDQGAYLQSIQAFAHGDLRSPNFFYPPLYPLAAAPFWPLLHRHATLVVDLACFLTAYGAVLAISRRFYGRILPAVVCALLFILAPIMSIDQWVIPWTTSLATALASVLLLIYARAERAGRPFRLASRRDWLLFGLFFLAYGAIVATRPLDIVVWLPLALAMVLRTAWSTAAAERRAAGRLLRLVQVGLLALVAGLVFVAFFFGFNLLVHHSLLGRYGSAIGAGYYWDRIPERLFSLLWNSSTAYAEAGHALFERFPLFGPIFALCLTALLVVRDIRFWIVVVAALHLLLYLPYGDLLPNGFFRYMNVHYFKWAYPWLAVIGVGQAAAWGAAARAGSRRARALLGAAAAVTAAGWALQLEPSDVAQIPGVPTGDGAILVTAPRPRKVEFIDIPGIDGGFVETYFGTHQLWIDGQQAPSNRFRLLPNDAGVRVLLMEPQVLRQVLLRPDPRLKIEPGPRQSTIGNTRIMPAALYRAPRIFVPWTDGRIDFDLGQGGETHGVILDRRFWAVGEPGGRWTIAHKAPLTFQAAPPAGDVRVSSDILPLHDRRVWGFRPRLMLKVNGCLVTKTVVDRLGPRTLQGVVPHRCLRPGGDLTVEWDIDQLRSPQSLHVRPDDRILGVLVRNLALVQTGAAAVSAGTPARR